MKEPKAAAGQRYGRWTLLEVDYTVSWRVYWTCKCDCGTVKSVLEANLLSGDSKSCGCIRRELHSKKRLHDLTEQRFGRYTVLRRGPTNKYGNVTWHCICDCGQERNVSANHLKDGTSRSCGCLVREKHRKSRAQQTVNAAPISEN